MLYQKVLDFICQKLLENNFHFLPESTCRLHKSNGVCPATISNTVAGFDLNGITYLKKLNRSPNSDQARRKVDGRLEAHIIALACGPVPEGHSRWTIRLLADELKVEVGEEEAVNKETIRRTLKKTNFDLTKTTTGVSPKKKIQNS